MYFDLILGKPIFSLSKLVKDGHFSTFVCDALQSGGKAVEARQLQGVGMSPLPCDLTK